MTVHDVAILALAIVAAAECAVIVLLKARIAGLEDRYWDEREMRIREANRHPLCTIVEGENHD